MTSKATSETCKSCQSSGLALWFVYHSALPLEEELRPSAASLLKTDEGLSTALGLPKLKKARYALRTLREGYLHVYHEKAPAWLKAQDKANGVQDADAGHWEVFRVKPGGALIPEGSASFQSNEPFSCTRENGSHLFGVLPYRLRSAHESGKIWVAFSANLWDLALRQQNKAKPDVMMSVDVPALLGGQLPANGRKPDAAWINSHVAEFAMDRWLLAGELSARFDYGISPVPRKPTSQQGEALVKRMAQHDASHPKTAGKSAIIALPDPVGTAAALADISRAQQALWMKWQRENVYPLEALERIDVLLQQKVEEQQVKQSIEKKSFASLAPFNAKGAPVDRNGNAHWQDSMKYPYPTAAERDAWVEVGYYNFDMFYENVRSGVLPPDARFFYSPNPYGGPGLIIAPRDSLARASGQLASRKLDRLHDKKAVADFRKTLEDRAKLYANRLTENDLDRVQVLAVPALRNYFDKHFSQTETNPLKEAYKPQDRLRFARLKSPGELYMSEASAVLLGATDATGPMSSITSKMLDPKKHPEWEFALRSLTANQVSVYGEMQSFTEFSVDWMTNIESKLDKTYDSLKVILVDEKILGARYAWANTLGIGLSFGLAGFFKAAAATALAAGISEQYPTLAKSVNEAIERRQKFLDKFSGDIRDAGLRKLSTYMQQIDAWCLLQGQLLDAALKRRPPAKPVYVRVTLTIEQALQALAGKDAGKFTEGTSKNQKNWLGLPEAARKETVALEFLTTDLALKNAAGADAASGSAKALSESADRVFIKVAKPIAGIPEMSLTLAQLADVYRNAHRFDGVKQALVDAIKTQVPDLAKLGLRGLSEVPRAGLGFGRGLATWEGQFGLFGAYLQWRASEKNANTFNEMKRRLDALPNLTPEQRAAVEDAKVIAEFGLYDNYAGMVGGLAECAKVGAEALSLTSTTALLSAGSAFAGSAGAFFNAMQNWQKASGKLREGDQTFRYAYTFVVIAYGAAGVALLGNAVGLIAEWLAKRGAIKVGTGFAARAITFAATKLNWVGWGVTILAFLAEGLVNWFDRTKLEAWVENCYFGDEPEWKTINNGRTLETKAWEAALQDARDQAMAQDKLA